MNIKHTVRDVLATSPLLDGLFRRMIWSRIHFPEMEMRFIHALPAGTIDVAIDVGAAHGSYAWILNRKSRDVYAFEPGMQHADYLEKCIVGTGIHLRRQAVGSFCGTVDMYTPGADANALHSATLSVENPVVSGLQTTSRKVDQVTLDSVFLNEFDVDRRIDVLKVDVEGYEAHVFEGARGLMARHHPLIVCEIEARHNARYGEVFSLLRSLGYRAYIYMDGEYREFIGEEILSLQNESDLAFRLGAGFRPRENRYINNFVFQHQFSRVRISN